MKDHQNLRAVCAAIPEGVDAVLVENPLHQFYLCGFPFEDGHIVLLRDAALLFVDFRYIEAARARVDGAAFLIFDKTDYAFLYRTLQERGVKRLGYEDRYMTVAAVQRLRIAMPGMETDGVGGLIEDRRVFKTPDEMECIRRAQAITDAAFAHILNYITKDKTESEIALELEFFMRCNGAERTSFNTISISGAKTSLPHGEPEARTIEPGFLTMDFGCVYAGYCSDMTRTVAVGPVSGEMRKVYDTVLEAQKRALAAIGWHKSCYEIDRVARDYINESGYPGAFGHSLGHGVGLYIHESPRLSPSVPPHTLLENGHVVTVEPGIYLAGKFGVRIEDMVLIHDGEAEDITKSPKELIIL